MSPRQPDLFLIGAQKGGSSSLFRLLAMHPGIGQMRRKECDIYIAETPEEAQARVVDLAAAPEQAARRWLLDASVNYSRFPKYPAVPALLRRLHPSADEVRFIYVLRHPVDRLISNYFWKSQLYGAPDEFAAAIARDPQYVETSRYDRQILHWLEHFDRDRFLFLKFEDFAGQPEETFARICVWLGLDPIAVPETPHAGATDKAVLRVSRAKLLTRVLWAAPRLRGLIRKALPDRVIRRASRLLTRETERVKIPLAQRRDLLDRHFRDSIARTAQLTGLDLDDWLTAYDAPAPGRDA